MKTVRLFWQDPLMGEFSACVIQSTSTKDGCEVVLDKTCFYPESGGQPFDLGTLGGLNVIDVKEDCEVVVHHLDGPGPPAGSTIIGNVDMTRRQDHSCQHTAQHIISAVAEKLWSVATVGFHLGQDSSSVDLENPNLKKVQLTLLETMSNDAAFQNMPVNATLESPARLNDARVKKDFDGQDQVRLVSIGDLDKCACCGTHLASTGQVGLIKFGKVERVRKSTRIEFYAGKRALVEFGKLQTLTDTLSSLTGSGKYELPEFIKSFTGEHKKLKRDNITLTKKLAQYEAQDLIEAASDFGTFKLVSSVLDSKKIGDLKEIATALREKGGVVALLGAEFEGKASMVFARSDDLNMDISVIFKNSISILGGRGGGRADMAQGGGGDPTKLDQTLASARAMVSQAAGMN